MGRFKSQKKNQKETGGIRIAKKTLKKIRKGAKKPDADGDVVMDGEKPLVVTRVRGLSLKSSIELAKNEASKNKTFVNEGRIFRTDELPVFEKGKLIDKPSGKHHAQHISLKKARKMDKRMKQDARKVYAEVLAEQGKDNEDVDELMES